MSFINKGIKFWAAYADKEACATGISLADSLISNLTHLYAGLIKKGKTELKKTIKPTDYEKEIFEEINLSFENVKIMKQLKEEDRGEILEAVKEYLEKARKEILEREARLKACVEYETF